MYDALVSADVVTPDPDGAAVELVSLLDLPAPRPNAFLEPAGHGFRAAWLRTHPSLAAAPTRIELIGARPRSEPHDYVQERIEAQGRRPVRTHATVLAGDVELVRKYLRENGVRHRVTPASADFAFDRVWIGVTEEDPLDYRPEVDAGLWLEVVPTPSSGIPTATIDRVADGPGVRRVRARRFLVDDIDAATRALEANLGLTATSVLAHQGGTTAAYVFAHPASAALELVAPHEESELGAFGRQWGPGPHAIVLEVGDLDNMTAALEERSVPVRRGHDAADADVLLIDPAYTLGVPFELVEARS